MSWSLFRVTAVDVKPVVRELRRIADGIEAYMAVAHNYHLTPPKPLPSDEKEPPSVAYASDESSALNEFREEFERMAGRRVDGEEEEEEAG